jgi:phospholipase C
MYKYYVKPFFEIRNHMELVSLTCEILRNDGKADIFLFLNSTDEGTEKTFMTLLEEGTKNADIPFSGGYICHMLHFHHPWTHRGYLSKRSSADKTVGLFTKATNDWRAGRKGRAIYHLGRTLHLIQDIFIPQHAGITSQKGHSELEKWLTDNWKSYQVVRGGYYHWEYTFRNHDDSCHHVTSVNPYDWIDCGSHISIDWFNSYFFDKAYDEDTFHKAAALIIPNVLRFSAGFIYRFFSEVDR